MKLVCLQETLRRGLALVSHAVEAKSTLPILANVLLSTDDGRLRLSATNLRISITCRLNAQVETEGAVTIPARLLGDMVGNLPNDNIKLALDARSQTLKVECGRFTSNIKGIDAEEFPSIPDADDRPLMLRVAGTLLREAIDQVAFAAANENDNTRPALTGVLVRLQADSLTLAAADGFRLATRQVPLPPDAAKVRDRQEFIVPARALLELARILNDDPESDVTMAVSPNGSQIMFHTPAADLIANLIDGKFPDFERVIPEGHETRIVTDTAALQKAVKLASFVAASSSNMIKVAVEPGGDDIEPGRLVLNATAAEIGDNTGVLDGSVSGAGGHVIMNARYLSEALSAIGTQQVSLEIRSPQEPGVFRPVGSEGYLHLVMPMTPRS